MGMAAILFSCAEPFEQMDRKTHVKSGKIAQMVSEKTFENAQIYTCTGQGQKQL